MLKSLIHIISNLAEKKYQPGDLIDDKYIVSKYLGSGSYGNSYLVKEKGKSKAAVLKTLRLHKRLSHKGRKQFLQESAFLSKLHHSSFPTFYAMGVDNKLPYFVMEYIKGKNFEEIIFCEGERFSEKESFLIASELLDHIGYLHDKKIVHRDIRIPNIMVEEGRVRIIDFGLAKQLPSEDTPFNLNDPNPYKELSVRSDFYGIGHFLLFLLYSSYDLEIFDRKEKGWQEELDILDDSKKVIRRLLQLDKPYHHWKEIKEDFDFIVIQFKEEIKNVIIQ
ncbi:serine/threonine protein kinase [Bacillus massilinigeriensis]|uniref:serine/threonine protein kinase n=1 Tax=Bacillus mediterraneensis TaxID=1805474 RepID=UPI00093F7FC1|nr:protein kinase [Bacillus mediterraneensis]